MVAYMYQSDIKENAKSIFLSAHLFIEVEVKTTSEDEAGSRALPGLGRAPPCSLSSGFTRLVLV